MHHCVVTRAVDVVAGRCALYRVSVGSERATLELTLGPDGAPVAIDEFRLACNAEPSDAAWETARQWLAEGQKRWRSAVTTWMVDAGERGRRSSCSWWLEHFRNRR